MYLQIECPKQKCFLGTERFGQHVHIWWQLLFSTFSDALHCLFGVHSKIDLSFLYLMRQETMMPCIDLSPSFMKMHLPLKVNLIAQPVQGINLQPLWLLLILTYHQRIFSSFLDTISINASISNSMKKNNSGSFDIWHHFFSAPLTFDVMVNYIINWICQFPQSWLVGNSAKNVAKYFNTLQKKSAK